MISRQAFVKIMNAIVKENNLQDDLNKVFRKYDCDVSIMNCGLEGAIVYYLQEEFNDLEDDWLGYLLYERNYLRDYELGDIQFADGTSPELNDWSDVYDFLIRCMNDKKTRKE